MIRSKVAVRLSAVTVMRSKVAVRQTAVTAIVRSVSRTIIIPRMRKKVIWFETRKAKKTFFSSSDEVGQSGNECVTPSCDWANEGKCIPGMVPIKCQYAGGCTKFAHHLCTIQWASENNVDEGGIATLCREHHPEYHQFCKQSSRVDSNRSGHCHSSSTAHPKDEEYVSLKKSHYKGQSHDSFKREGRHSNKSDETSENGGHMSLKKSSYKEQNRAASKEKGDCSSKSDETSRNGGLNVKVHTRKMLRKK